MTDNLIGRKVISATDDRPCPTVGMIVATHGNERVSVRWYDWQAMGSAVTTTEYLDEIAPWRER